MNEQNYKDLKNNLVKIFNHDTVIAEGIKNLIEQLAEYFQANTQDVLFVTMKEFTNEYKTDSTIQYFHYLESVKPEKLVNMLNFLELTRQ